MSTGEPDMLVEKIRSSPRQIVRELGFMNNAVAGTNYPSAAVHVLLEIGDGNPKTASQLSAALNVDRSTVKQIMLDLLDAGEVIEGNKKNGSPSGEKSISLTPRGYQTLADVNVYARDKVLKALNHLPARDAETIVTGLQTYAASLHAQRTGKKRRSAQNVQIISGYQPGIAARCVQMQIEYYSRTQGFGIAFEADMAKTLAEFLPRLQNPRNEIWAAVVDGKIMGTLYIDGENLGSNKALLKAFIVDSEARGGGIGRRLLSEAVAFAERQGFEETHLLTSKGLDVARLLYESVGFVLVEEYEQDMWEKRLLLQRLVRQNDVGMVINTPVAA